MKIKIDAHRFLDNILHWRWSKSLLFWLIISAGTFSELAFLLASVWMSVNAAEHGFVRMFMDETQSVNISYWAKSAYVILPVCILPLGIVTTIRHLRTWIYNRKFFYSSGAWFALYGVPTATFLVIDVAIIGNSNAAQYVLPDALVTARSIMAYSYGLVAIIYHYIGKQQEVDRLKQKDDFISQLVGDARVLSDQIETLNQEIADQKAETERQKMALAESKAAHKRVIEESQKSDEEALNAYGNGLIQWLKTGIKTATVEEIMQVTGISKRKINGANLQRSTRNQDLILISSLVSWLKTLPMPTVSRTTNGHNTEPIDISQFAEQSA